jgi:hypothetical protein
MALFNPPLGVVVEQVHLVPQKLRDHWNIQGKLDPFVFIHNMTGTW